ncbi:Arginine/ornithine N-succinyltransferase beta subunit [Burkholderia dolosa AU0158]|nr:Arginine/ornithine N-succinyltransferase beta subunit [Burkholderia dolosa AU0158]
MMEDSNTGDIAGVCGIETQVGLEQPFYNYRVSTVVHASQELGVWTRMSALNISHDLTGYAEVCSLFLSPRYRTGGVGGLLSRSRFMFIAQFRDRFPERLCSGTARPLDEDGTSPSWRAVGSHFYQIDFNAADYLSSHGRKSFLAGADAALSGVRRTRCPQDAQDACRPHASRHGPPPAKMLEAEGLRYQNHVDIFDAGPVLECHINDLRTVRESVVVPAAIGVPNAGDDAQDAHATKSLVSNTSLADFRVGVAPGIVANGSFVLSADDAAALRVNAGDPVRVLPLKAKQG